MDLYFNDFKAELNNHFTQNGWTKVCDNEMFCGLIEPSDTCNAMAHYNWDLHYQDSRPVVEMTLNPHYARFGSSECEALAIYREGYGAYANYVELSEEFLLFYNLRLEYKTPISKVYYAIVEDGTREDVVMIEGMKMLVATNYLKRYIATRQLNLLVFFDLIRNSDNDFSSLDIEPIINVINQQTDCITVFSLVEGCEKKAVSRFEGKVLIEYNSNDFVDPFDQPKCACQNFIFGCDASGNPLETSCDKDNLPNRFNYSGTGPYVMTPVFFRKAVLDKYYSQPNLYSVEDGCIRCGDSWVFTTIDNDQRDYVVVPLGYLGDLPEREQLHWKSYNVKPPYQGSFSNTAYTRWEKGEAVNPTFPDLLFKIMFLGFNNKWKEKYGWPLFLPLVDEDQHRWRTLHCLTVPNNNVDFDEQVLSLTKITVDSLNQEELKKNINSTKQEVIDCLKEKNKELKEITAGIDKFQLFNLSEGFDGEDIIKYMRNLQSLRSFDVAHRKSSDPKKREKFLEYFDYYNKTQQIVLEELFAKWLDIFQTLENQIK